jgi:hypothetical protein
LIPFVLWVAFIELCNAVDKPVQKGAGEDVLRAARSFVEVLQRWNGGSCP